jgi:hypothetical protein
MYKCRRLVTNVDYFGQRVELTFNKEKYFKSVLGGIFSILMYCACFSFVISIGLQLVLKLNPSTIVSTQKEPTAPLIDISKEDLLFAAYILTSDYEPLNDPSIATISGYQYILNRTDAEVYSANVPLELTNCSLYKSYFNERGFTNDFNNNRLEKGLCFKFLNNTIIGGNFILDYFSNVFLSVEKCNNVTSKVQCKPNEIIEAKLKRSYFELYYLDWNIDLPNYDVPFNRFFANYFTLIDPFSQRLVDLYFKKSEVLSNTGFLFDSFENKTKVIFERFREQIDPSDNPDSKILELYINISDNLTTNTRIYMKFQDFCANIGGLIQACIIIGYLLTDLLTHYDMHEYMMNCLFSFKKEEEVERSLSQINFDIAGNRSMFKYFNIAIKKKDNKVINKSEPIILSNNNFILRSINQSKVNENSEAADGSKDNLAKADNKEKEINTKLEEKIKQFNNSLSTNFKISFRNKIYKIMNDYLGCKFQRRIIKLYDVAYRKLHGYLDFLKIIKLLKEFRQLKKIFLSKGQYRIFKNHDLQVIRENDEEDLHDDEKESKVNYYELYTQYSKGKEKAKCDKVYRRLIQNFDKNLGVIFEKIEEANNS